MTNIEPNAKRLIYQFLGEEKEFSDEDLQILLESDLLDAQKLDRVIQFLLYYVFLGIKYLGDEEQYFFDVEYNMELLKTRITKNKRAVSYVFNRAF